MKINELIRKIREDRNYSLSEIGEKVGFAKGTIKTVESGQAPMSKNLFEGYVKAFPLMKDILLKSYLKQFICLFFYWRRGKIIVQWSCKEKIYI